jgi:hypothetical protein
MAKIRHEQHGKFKTRDQGQAKLFEALILEVFEM